MENFKCPYCEKIFSSYNGLTKHVIRFKKHGEISREKLLSDYKYNGVRPTCACGCGEETGISYQDGAHFNELIQGHYSRIHNNWGHNAKALENSAETRRERFKSGEIVQWNKGKTWEETYDDEQINKLLESYENPERSKKISLTHKGIPKTEEHNEKVRKNKRRPEIRKFYSKILMERIKNQEFSLSSKAENDFAIKYLDILDIQYETQKYIKEIKQYVDFYVPEKDIYIEFDGDYYHTNPRKYPDGPINEMQKKKD